MSYYVIEDFRLGLDRRKHVLSLPIGALYVARNANITRGGEVETCKDFVSKYTLPAGTFGLAAAAGQLFVFGSVADPGVPPGVQYQRLQHPSNLAMTDLVWAAVIKGKVYAIAAYQGGSICNFYNGTIVSDWQSGAVGGVMASNADVASHFAAIINTDPNYSATSIGSVVTITGLPNVTYTITASAIDGGANNDQTATVATVQASTSTKPQISTVTIGGTFQAADTFSIVLGGTSFGGLASGAGEQAVVVIAYKGKAYAIAGPNLFGSEIDNPSNWDSGTGKFVIDMSSQAEGAERLTALAIFQKLLVIFSRATTQLWAVDPDPANNAEVQVMQNIGTLAPKSVKAYGDQDVFFLSDTGLRSLKVRMNSDSAALSDIGSPVDPLIIAAIAAAGGAASKAVAAIDPVDGRYLLHIGRTTYAFSFFPSGKVSGWSTYEFNLPITDFAVLGQRLFARAGNTIYLLGGDNYDQYSTLPAFVRIPFMGARQISTWKHYKGFDVTCDGQWTVGMCTKVPDFEAGEDFVDETVDIVTKSTYGLGEAPADGEGELLSLSFTSKGGEYARLAGVVVHYEPMDAT